MVDNPVITNIAQRIHKTPAQVALAWAVQRGTAFLTTSTTPHRIQENFEISSLPEEAMREMRNGITTSVLASPFRTPVIQLSFRLFRRIRGWTDGNSKRDTRGLRDGNSCAIPWLCKSLGCGLG